MSKTRIQITGPAIGVGVPPRPRPVRVPTASIHPHPSAPHTTHHSPPKGASRVAGTSILWPVDTPFYPVYLSSISFLFFAIYGVVLYVLHSTSSPRIELRRVSVLRYVRPTISQRTMDEIRPFHDSKNKPPFNRRPSRIGAH